VVCVFICFIYKRYRITKNPYALQLFGHWSCFWVFTPCRRTEALRGMLLITFPCTPSLLVQIGHQPPYLFPRKSVQPNLYVHNHSFALPNPTLKMEVIRIYHRKIGNIAHFRCVQRPESRIHVDNESLWKLKNWYVFCCHFCYQNIRLSEKHFVSSSVLYKIWKFLMLCNVPKKELDSFRSICEWRNVDKYQHGYQLTPNFRRNIAAHEKLIAMHYFKWYVWCMLSHGDGCW
jgi:hypothetical protein